jgi:hypothetical protein
MEPAARRRNWAAHAAHRGADRLTIEKQSGWSGLFLNSRTGRPVNICWAPCWWQKPVWTIDRRILNRSAIAACLGSNSQTCIPGTLVAIGK